MAGPHDVREHASITAARRQTLDELARRSVSKYSGTIALRGESAVISYDELGDRIEWWTRTFHALGVGKGGRVAILMRNRVELVEAFLGAVRLGAIAVPVNFRLAAPEIAHLLSDSRPSVVLTDDVHADMVSEALSQHDAAVELIVLGTTALPAVAEAELPDPCLDPSDPAALLYTSGTTGRPKGALLSHGALVSQVLERAAGQHLTGSREVWLSGLQLFHVAGLTGALASIAIGGEFIALAGGVGAEHLADLLETHRVTTCSLVPSQLKELTELPGIGRRRFALERVSWGSAAADRDTLERLSQTFEGIELITVYGQTESCGISTALTGAETFSHLGSIGRPLPLVELSVVDEQGTEVADGVVGELVLRGPSLMRGYWNDPAATAEVFRGGWLHTGDLGHVDSEGVYWVVGRSKDMIISGGENIYASEVENVISRHPKVSEVAVVGVPDARWGETPVAVVVPVDPADPPSHEEIVSLSLRYLASYKKPTRTVILDTLPRGATGKIRKVAIRDSLTGGRDG